MWKVERIFRATGSAILLNDIYIYINHKDGKCKAIQP